MHPLLKWAGGKAALSPVIRTHFSPCTGRYIEPFVGGGAVFFDRASQEEVQSAILADNNERLIAFYQHIQAHPDDVLEETSKFTWGESWKEDYKKNRDEFNKNRLNSPRSAALFYWMNHACFNGLYRVNQSGEFNVPVGSYARLSPPDEETIHQASQLLQRTILRCTDFYSLLCTHLEPEDQVYADPPYVPNVENGFTAYAKTGFSEQDQTRLARILDEKARTSVRVVASNHDVPFVRELYGKLGFTLFPVQGRRSVGAKGSTRKKVGELLLVGYVP